MPCRPPLPLAGRLLIGLLLLAALSPGMAHAGAPSPGSAGEIAITLRFDPESLTLAHDATGDRVELQGAVSPSPDSPALPLVPVRVLLPEGVALSSVDIEAADPWQAPGKWMLEGKSEKPADAGGAAGAGTDALVWDAPFAWRAEGEAWTGTMRGYVIASVLVSPLEWVASTGELRLNRRLDVRVHYDTAPPETAGEVRRRDPSRPRDSLEGREIAWLRRFVANPQDLERFYGQGASPALAEVSVARPFAGFLPTPFPSTDGPAVEYVIVTDSVAVDGRPVGDLVAEFQRLADWKVSKGTPAVVRTVSWIRANYPGHDDAARIRAFLIDAFELWGTDYVLLGGDLRIVPGRRFNGLNLGAGHPPADVYYGGLDGSWDLDRDAVYGEPFSDAAANDPLWDVWVGRAPVENRAEAAVFVDKSLSYARAPGSDLTGLDPDYYERILLMEGLANCPDWARSCNGIYVGETIYRRIAPSFFERTRMYQQLLDPNPTCSYHETYVEVSDSVQVDWTTTAALNALNRGSGFVHHYEHSNPYEEGGASLGFGCNASVGGSLGREYIDQLTNKPNWSIVYSTGAGVHAFDYESVSEHWVLNPNGGAVAYVGKTRSGSFANTTGEVDTLFFADIFQSGTSVGQATAFSTQGVSAGTLQSVSSFGLIGDPDLQPWTSTPTGLSVSINPPQFVPGEEVLDVTVSATAGGEGYGKQTSAPVAGARVALKQGTRAYAFAITDGSGNARFGVTLPTRDNVILTVTAPNHSPAVVTVAPNPAGSAQVSYRSHAATDDSVGVTNQNGVVDAGEVIKLDVTVENTGLVQVNGVTGTLAALGEVDVTGSINGGCDPNRVYIGAQSGHPPADCVLRFPDVEFGGVNPRGVPDRYLMTSDPGLFVWRDGPLWRVVARGSPIVGGQHVTGTIQVAGGQDGAVASALEGGDLWSATGPGTITFDFTAQAAGDRDSLAFNAREILWLTIPDATGQFGNLANGAQSISHFVIAFTNAIPDRHEPRFELSLRDGGNAEVGRTSFSVPVAAPVLEYVRQSATLISGGGTIAGVIRNSGSGVADLAKATLRLESGTGTVTDSLVALGSIAGMAEAGGGGDVFAFSSLNPSALRFQVILENRFPDATKRTWSRSRIDVVQPCPPAGLAGDAIRGRSARLRWVAPSASCAPDLAGYNVYRRQMGGGAFTLIAGSAPDSTPSFEDPSLPADSVWEYKVAARDSSGNESPQTNAVAVSTWVAEHAGWPRPLDAGTNSSPLAVDVDGDGVLEIFALGNAVYAWHADGTPLLNGPGSADGTFFRPPRPPGNMSQGATGAFLSSPAIADIDRNGSLEIAVAAWDDSVWVLEAATGALRWGRRCVPKYSSPALADLNGDGNLEVIVGSDADTVYVWQADGSPLIASRPTGAFAALPDGATINYTTPAIADIDGNPNTSEVIYATFRGNVYAWNGSGTLLWSCDVGPSRPLSTPAIGDVDNDGTLEVVVAQGNAGTGPAGNALFIINAVTGAIEQSWFGNTAIPGNLFTPGNIIHPPSLADLDGNGDLEIVVGTSGVTLPSGLERAGGGTVLVFNHDAASGFSLACLDTIPLPGLNMTNVSQQNVDAQPVIANIDADGGFEIGAGSSTFAMFLFDVPASMSSCTPEAGWPILVSGEIGATPWIGDVDDDGRFDMVLRSNDGDVHVFDLGGTYNPQAIRWGQFAHDPQHTSNVETTTVVGVPPGSPPGAPVAVPLRLALPVPNPSRPPARIGFELGSEGRVRLAVYAVDGRLVRMLMDGFAPSGRHQALWDGRDDRGQEQPAGVYFYRLEAGGRSAARKLLIIK